ncbi:hypothetical protein TRIP_B200130 [uncultured Desulfatiglans sp.]|uniref:Uncharacterized protein n=1 Tax=Uncultured Desulfatiglans sp. TaxID=1748965 RepID=A0A653A1T3_UNCDX|nr:hypothetical protein TRIP_B200130 [uncultured Desulfatiglans sp.]
MGILGNYRTERTDVKHFCARRAKNHDLEDLKRLMAA